MSIRFSPKNRTLVTVGLVLTLALVACSPFGRRQPASDTPADVDRPPHADPNGCCGLGYAHPNPGIAIGHAHPNGDQHAAFHAHRRAYQLP